MGRSPAPRPKKKELGAKIKEDGTLEVDLSKAHLKAGFVIPNEADWETLIDGAEKISASQNEQLGTLSQYTSSPSVFYTSGSMSEMQFIVSGSQRQNIPEPQRERAEEVRIEFEQIFQRTNEHGYLQRSPNHKINAMGCVRCGLQQGALPFAHIILQGPLIVSE